MLRTRFVCYYLSRGKIMKVFIAGTVDKRINHKYLEGIKKLATLMREKNYEIMCVGAKTGSIGEMYNQFVKNDGHVDLIVPVPYADEAKGMKANSATVVDSLFILQQIALRNTEATIVLPGGNGTLAELYMITDSIKSKFDHDIVIIYNVNGFYDKIKEMNQFMFDNGCLTEAQFEYFTFCDTPEDVMKCLEYWDIKRKNNLKYNN